MLNERKFEVQMLMSCKTDGKSKVGSIRAQFI